MTNPRTNVMNQSATCAAPRAAKPRPLPATLENLVDHLVESGLQFALDTERKRVAVVVEGAYRVLSDVDMIALRIELERRGFARVPRARLRDAIRYLAISRPADLVSGF